MYSNGITEAHTMSNKDNPDVPTPQGPLKWGGVADDIFGDINGFGVLTDATPLTINNCYTTRDYVDSTLVFDEDGNTRIKGDLIIEGDDGEDIDVGEFIKSISERLCVLQPNFEAMEQYPALKDAYDQYKMLEKLLMEKDNGNKG